MAKCCLCDQLGLFKVQGPLEAMLSPYIPAVPEGDQWLCRQHITERLHHPDNMKGEPS